MAQLLIVCPLRPATQERWRRLYQDIAASRREQFEVFCRQAGISQVQVWLGWNVQEVLPEQQQELIFAWPGESFGS